MAEEVTIVISADDQASKTLKAVGDAFNKISGAIKDVTSKYIEYGKQVEDLSLFTGVSNEQTSRMIQLADDAFVSYDTLRMAMKSMADKGLQPTVDNLAKVSDAFQAIKDPAARSAFLLDEFGRSGMQMAKVMTLGGEEIRKMAASIEEGLIIDDKKAESIKKTRQELDAFNDSIDAMKYQVAGQLLDIFNAMPKPLQDATLALSQLVSPTNINSLIQFGILLKGLNFTKLAAGITAAGGSIGLALAPIAAVGIALWAIDAFMKKVVGEDWFNKGLEAGVQLVKLGIAGISGLAATSPMELLSGNNANYSKAYQSSLSGWANGGAINGLGIVGEHGPELFAGRGTIIPNHALGGSPIIINYSPTIGAATSDDLERIGYLVEQALRRRR